MMPGCGRLERHADFAVLPGRHRLADTRAGDLDETPATAFFPLVTLTVIFCDLPLPWSSFGATVTVAQISGDGVGFVRRRRHRCRDDGWRRGGVVAAVGLGR